MDRHHVSRARKYVREWVDILDIHEPVDVALETVETEEDLLDAFAVISDFGDQHRIDLNEDMSISDLRRRYRLGLEELIVHELLHIKNEPVERRAHKWITDRRAAASMNNAVEDVLDELARVLVRTKRHYARRKA